MTLPDSNPSSDPEAIRSSGAEYLGREGIVTVWDHHGRYVGCLGVDLWRALLAAGLSVDLTLRCPICGRRADMCFKHGDDWKKR